MYMGANLLTRLRGAKDPDDRNLGSFLFGGAMTESWQLGIEVERRCLVMINAVKSDTENIHGGLFDRRLEEQTVSGTMVNDKSCL